MFERAMFLINLVDKREVIPTSIRSHTALAATGRPGGHRRRENAYIALFWAF